MQHPAFAWHRAVRADEAPLLALTAARLLLAVPLVWGIGHNRALAAVALLAIVAMDILDGVLARAAGLDGTMRRIIDAGVDRLLIHTASITVVLTDTSLLILYAPLALRDIIMAAVDLWCIARRHTHIAGRSLHRASSASFALLGFAVLVAPHFVAVCAALVAWLVNYALLFDYLPAVREVLAGPPSPVIAVRTTDTNSNQSGFALETAKADPS